MCVHMERKIVDLVEGFLANVAFELLAVGVRQSVVLVVALLMEAFPAYLHLPNEIFFRPHFLCT